MLGVIGCSGLMVYASNADLYPCPSLSLFLRSVTCKNLALYLFKGHLPKSAIQRVPSKKCLPSISKTQKSKERLQRVPDCQTLKSAGSLSGASRWMQLDSQQVGNKSLSYVKSGNSEQSELTMIAGHQRAYLVASSGAC